jgi:hypothetical protein
MGQSEAEFEEGQITDSQTYQFLKTHVSGINS